MATRVRSFCKINLGLGVGPAREDGYHSLATVYQTIGLHDQVTVSAFPSATTRIIVEADRPGVPCTANGDGERNTAYRMVASMLPAMGITAEVRIQIEKRLPIQGGLGAGSANAAAALIALERETGTALPGADRLRMAAAVGSDVPLFLLGGTVLGLGRGELVFPMPDSPAVPVVVAVPEVGISTTQAFRDLDAAMESRNTPGRMGDPDEIPGSVLTKSEPSVRITELIRVFSSAWATSGTKRVPTGIAPSAGFAGGFPGDDLRVREDQKDQGQTGGDLAENPLLALAHTGVENDFESVAFRQHSSLCDLKRALAGYPDSGSRALYSALSGSGSALFGLYRSTEAAHEAQQRVQALQTRALLTETLPREQYWDRMFA